MELRDIKKGRLSENEENIIEIMQKIDIVTYKSKIIYGNFNSCTIFRYCDNELTFNYVFKSLYCCTIETLNFATNITISLIYEHQQHKT